MVQVTLTIESPDRPGALTEHYSVTGSGPMVLPLVFMVARAVVGAHKAEVSLMATAAKVVADALAAISPKVVGDDAEHG